MIQQIANNSRSGRNLFDFIFPIFSMLATCTAHLILLDWNILTHVYISMWILFELIVFIFCSEEASDISSMHYTFILVGNRSRNSRNVAVDTSETNGGWQHWDWRTFSFGPSPMLRSPHTSLWHPHCVRTDVRGISGSQTGRTLKFQPAVTYSV